MHKKHIYFFLGTNAELIKIAPIIKELKKRKIQFKIITSGQNTIHFEDLNGFIGNTQPDISFKKKVDKSSVLHFFIWAVRTFLSSLFLLSKEFKGLNKNNSYIIIQGDTVSSTMGALIGKIFDLKLAHIESGDLSFNLLEPFPEEICRTINIRLADILFAPNSWAENNLKNVKGVKINTKYNTLIETFCWALNKKPNKSFKKYKKYYVLFMHRQEHVIFSKTWSRKILEHIISTTAGDINCVLLNHPLTVQIIKSLGIEKNSTLGKMVNFIPSQPYPDFLQLMKQAEYVVTDGCSLQLETFLLGKPCLILRNLTEQIEGVDKNIVICKKDTGVINDFLKNFKKYKTKQISLKVKPSKIIVDYLISH